MRVLLLGGTGEAYGLAQRLDADRSVQVISSLAGRTTAPRLPEGQVRVGGFGGVDQLAAYLRAEGIGAVVDATHPFAARITVQAARACARLNVPSVVLRRPGWTPSAGDDWDRVPDVAAAAAAVAAAPPGVVLLTLGRTGAAAFAGDDRHRFVIRCVEPPTSELPRRHHVLLDRGPFSLDAERAVLRAHRVGWLVTRDSGGPAAAAKLTASRELGVPVVMVDRPPLPADVAVVSDVDQAQEWLARLR